MITREEAKNCVGKGWLHLIDDFYNYLEENNYKVEITKVKEKYGGLRISYDILSDTPNDPTDEERSMDDNICDKINDLDGESLLTCENCGQRGEIKIINDRIKTLCNKCNDRT